MTEELISEPPTRPEWRNPAYNAYGSIDLEINDPSHGWIPFTATPFDAEEQGRNLHAAVLEAGGIAPYRMHALSQEELRATIFAAVQSRLDEFAQSRGYDDILSAVTYAGDTIPQFAADGKRAAELRGQTWAVVYRMMAEVHAGTRPSPASYADIKDDLPRLEWLD